MTTDQETRAVLIRRLDELTDVHSTIVCEEGDGDPITDEVFALHDQLQRGAVYAEDVRLAMHPNGLNGPTLIVTGTDFDGEPANVALTLTMDHLLSIGEFYMQQLIARRGI